MCTRILNGHWFFQLQIGRSENESTTQFSPSEDEVRPGVKRPRKTFHSQKWKSLSNQTGWPYLATISTNEERTCFEQEKLTTVISTPGLTSFSNDEICFIFLFSGCAIVDLVPLHNRCLGTSSQSLLGHLFTIAPWAFALWLIDNFRYQFRFWQQMALLMTSSDSCNFANLGYV